MTPYRIKDGTCHYCRQPIVPDWAKDHPLDISDRDHCSVECLVKSWMDYAKVPRDFFGFDPTKLDKTEQVKNSLAWAHDRRDWDSLPDSLGFRDVATVKPGLLLHGRQSGTGKTRTATAAMGIAILGRWPGTAAEEEYRQECEQDQVRHYPAGVWFNTLRFRQEYLKVAAEWKDREPWIDDIVNCNCLLLDDICKIKPTESILEVLHSVLDERLTANRTTILTTNLAGPELAKRWGEDFGPYIVRRLRDYCKCIDFDL
ncbi:MAG: hypothetical protein AB9869_25995 [Verrucomicrobiia bacterium]